MFPQMTGYDRAITVFSPDGRLLQVEYALAATRRTPIAVGMKCNSGVVLLALKKHVSPLATPPEKIYQVDKHIGAIAAGLVGDGLVLIERSRVEAQYNRIIFGEPITVKNLARKIAVFKQQYTQYAGLRPFGVMMIFGGVDEAPELYVTHPGGAFFSYKAFAVGKNSDKVNEAFKQDYNPDMTLEECLIHILKLIIPLEEGEVTPSSFEAAFIGVEDKQFRKLTPEEIAPLFQKAKGGE